jgi:formamidopyrimidine-DNA glycosylase
MPELPEVETVVRELQQSLVGHKFTEIITTRDNIREEIPDLSGLEGKKITSVSRRAKYIVINNKLVIHLGMSGTIRVGKPQPRKKHDHVIFQLDNGEEMVFNDPRRFGLVTLYNEKYFNGPNFNLLLITYSIIYIKQCNGRTRIFRSWTLFKDSE